MGRVVGPLDKGALGQCSCRGQDGEALAQTTPVGRREARDGRYLVLVSRNGSHRKGHLLRHTGPRRLLRSLVASEAKETQVERPHTLL